MRRPGIRRLFSLGRRNWEREVEEEILTHLTIRAERLVALGMTPQAAKDEAIRRFGALDESRERLLEAAAHREQIMRRQERFTELRQDLAFAARTLRRNKGWAAVAIVTLALGIGATTAVWSAATTLLLHPLSYPDAGRVVNVNLMPTTGNSTGVDVAVTPPAKQIRAWRADARAFEALEPYGSSATRIGTGVDANDVIATKVLPTFAGFAGERAIIGRNFTAADVAARTPVAVLAEQLWRTRFGADSGIVGRTLTIGGSPVRVVGVMPASLRTPRIGGRATEVWLPLDLSNEQHGYRIVGRLREGMAAELAARELDSISVRSGIYQAGTLPFRAAITTPGQSVRFRDSLLMLTGAVFLVLLVAAANVAHLLLARVMARGRELAIRTAMGASRTRLVRQMATETVALTAAGCLAGAALGYGALKAIVAMAPPTLPELAVARVDGTALLFVLAASAVCALGFGIVSAFAMSARPPIHVLRSGVVAVFSRGGERLRSSLVVSEMALSAVLLIGAVLLVRSVIELQRTDLGFEPENLHALSWEFPDRYATPPLRLQAARELAARLEGIPGISAVTVTDAIPGFRNFGIGALQIEGQPAPSTKTTSFIDLGRVSSTYFRTVGARMVAGRALNDSLTGLREIVINEGFARKHWTAGEAIGRRIRINFTGGEGQWMTIVGVVADVASMGPGGDKGAPFLFTPIAESQGPGIMFRTNGSESALAGARSAFKSSFPNVRLTEISAATVVGNSIAPSRFIMLLMTGFTVLAVILAAVGLYGMMAYAVAQRTREIGIRMALGATRESIARAVIGRGALLGLIGATAGAMLAVWGTRLIEASLHGVSRLDVTSFAVGGALLIGIAVIASLAPMRRALAVDPMTSIRAD